MNILLNLQPYVDRDIKINDYYQEVVENLKYKGNIYALPLGFNVHVLYYNTELFDEAGVSYPDESWTWKELLEAAKRLTKDKNNDGRIDQFGFIPFNAESLIKQNGGDILNKEGTECIINSIEAIEALEFLHDLIYKYRVSPTPAESLSQSTIHLFQMKRLVMFIGGRWVGCEFRKVKSLRWAIAPVPAGKAGRAVPLSIDSMAIVSQSRHPEEAWEFIKYFAGPKAQRIIKTQKPEDISAIKEISIETLLKNYPSENNNVFLDALSYAFLPVSYRFKGREIDEIIRRRLDKVWLDKRGREDIQEICNQIKMEGDRLLLE